MEAIRIRGGHRFRIKHAPSTERSPLTPPSTVGLSVRGLDGVKPKLAVKAGDVVKRGDVLFHDKKRPDVKFTSPAGGVVKEVRYGRRRVLDAIILELDEAKEEAKDFGATDRGQLAGLGSEAVVSRLVESGLWTRFRAFPGWEVAPIPGEQIPEPAGGEHGPPPKEPPTLRAIYVSAVASEPHLPDPAVVLEGHEEELAAGLEVLKQVAKTWLISKQGKKLPSSAVSVTGVQHRVIEDKFPADNVGLQAYYTERFGKEEVVVGLDVEDVIDIGHLFLKGTLRTTRTYAVAGNAAKERKHFLARAGVSVADLTGIPEEKNGIEHRFVGGGLFTGSRVRPNDFLSPFERGVQVLQEDRVRHPFALLRPGFDHLTLFRTWVSGWLQGVEREATTSNNGEERPCVQCGACIDICPIELMPNLVFKHALEGDIEKMERSFIHDCIDCGLCTFVCPSKIEIAQHIEDGKKLIAKEG